MRPAKWLDRFCKFSYSFMNGINEIGKIQKTPAINHILVLFPKNFPLLSICRNPNIAPYET